MGPKPSAMWSQKGCPYSFDTLLVLPLVAEKISCYNMCFIFNKENPTYVQDFQNKETKKMLSMIKLHSETDMLDESLITCENYHTVSKHKMETQASFSL